MFRAILKKEIMQIILSWRFFIGTAICLILTILMLYVRNEVYKEELANFQEAQKSQEERIQKSFSLQWPEYFIYKKPTPLSILCEGIMMEETYEGLTYKLGNEENPFKVLFYKIDLPWIIGVVMSLIALIFAHDAISGEREGGTLSVVFSNAVSKNIVLLGKWLASVSALVIILLLILLLTFIFMLSNSIIQLRHEDFAALGLMGIASFLYLALFSILGIAISVKSSHSSDALLTLLALWSAFVLLIPTTVPDLAHFITKTSSENIFRGKMHQIKATYTEEWQKELDKWKASGDREKMLWAVAGKNGAFRRGWLALLREKAKLEDDYNNKLKKEIDLSILLSSLSPYASFNYMMSDLSNKGINNQNYFSRMARNHMQKFLDWFENQLDEFYKSGKLEQIEAPIDTSTMPRYQLKEPGIKERILFIWPYVLIILFFNVFFLALAYTLFVKRRNL